MKVRDLIEQKGSDVASIPRNVGMEQAISTLGSKNIGALVVVEADGSVCGILSERDIVRHISISGQAILSGLVEGFMTRNVVTCGVEDTLDDIMTTMTNKRIRHLPVIEGGKLSGIISIGDVVKRKIELAEQEASDLRQYITT